jgi:hypothetical protein
MKLRYSRGFSLASKKTCCADNVSQLRYITQKLSQILEIPFCNFDVLVTHRQNIFKRGRYHLCSPVCLAMPDSSSTIDVVNTASELIIRASESSISGHGSHVSHFMQALHHALGGCLYLSIRMPADNAIKITCLMLNLMFALVSCLSINFVWTP